MSPYKALIALVTVVLIGGAGFYFNAVGVPDLIARDLESGKDGKTYGVSAVEVFSGAYECIEKTGCKNTTRLILQQDTTLDITALVDGQEVSLGQGTWGIGTNGALTVILQNSEPGSLIAKKITTLTISGFSTRKGLFPGMENPTFNRVNSTHSGSGEDAR